MRVWASFGLEQEQATREKRVGETRAGEEGRLKLVSLQPYSHIKKLLSQVKTPVLDAEQHEVKLAVKPKSK